MKKSKIFCALKISCDCDPSLCDAEADTEKKKQTEFEREGEIRSLSLFSSLASIRTNLPYGRQRERKKRRREGEKAFGETEKNAGRFLAGVMYLESFDKVQFFERLNARVTIARRIFARSEEPIK